jgi:hypothetical protein
MGQRIDAVVLSGPVVFVVEFKVSEFERAALDQVWDYALDLKNFHEASHAVAIVPILVATEQPQRRRRAAGRWGRSREGQAPARRTYSALRG